MDLLEEIRDKLKNNSALSKISGLESVSTHIEVAERYHYRAKSDKDEHLYTDVIYRTNHAFEGILKEAYEILSGNSAQRMTPYEIEEYLLTESILKGRVVDLLTNYRQNWRNPSTHDYQLFFTEQESYLAIVNVSAFVSILLDQIGEKLVFTGKFSELKNAATLAREHIDNFDQESPINKAYKVLMSYSSYYLKHFDEMNSKDRSTINAEMAAFLQSVAPNFEINISPEIHINDSKHSVDLILEIDNERIIIETRSPKPHDSHDESAVTQLIGLLKDTQFKNGIVYHYPGHDGDTPVATTMSSGWPKDLNLREVYSDDPELFKDHDIEEPVDLVN